MNRATNEIRASESQFKFINERICAVEKYFSELCYQFASLTRRTAKLRDRGDELSCTVANYANQENLNSTLRIGLTKFAECLSAVQDYRQAQIERLEVKVVHELSGYGASCKHAKEDLKSSFTARAREHNRKRHLQKLLQKNPNDRHQISQAESEVQKASVEASRTGKLLEEQMDQFESKKLTDVKKILGDFVNIELLFHAKALEMYTLAFNNLMLIDEQDDLQEFRNKLHLPTETSRLDLVQASSHSALNIMHSSLNSLSNNNSLSTLEPVLHHKNTQNSELSLQNVEGNESDECSEMKCRSYLIIKKC